MNANSGSPPGRAWQRALTALRAGDASGAEQLCRRALQRDRDNAQLLNVLGAALIELGRPAAAEESLRRAVELAPSVAAGHEGLAETLLQQGKTDDALARLEIARRLEPGRVSVLVKLGGLHMSLGQAETALGLYRELAERAPGNVDALRLLADAAQRCGLLRECEAVRMRAAALAPQRAELWFELARVQLQQDKFERAEQSLREAIRQEPEHASAHSLLGSTLNAAGRHEQAVAALERALELNPRDEGARTGLAHALGTLGQTDRAIAAYREAIAINPQSGSAYWGLASLKTFRFGNEHIEAMRRQIDSGELSAETATNFEFAIATALEAQGHYDLAWEHFRAGNDSMRRRIEYDAAAAARIDAELMRVFDAPMLRRQTGAGNPDPAPIFIVGMPRSGSTLIEQILASHSLVEGTHELPELSRMANEMSRDGARRRYPELLLDAAPELYRALGSEYLDRTRRYRGDAPHFTDKMSSNFRHVGLISLILPNARVINARRHPLDSCLGCYKMLFSRGQKFTYELGELAGYYLQYERLMEHWHAVLPGFVLDVDYEHLVADLEGQVRRMLEFCALPWEPQCLDFHLNRRAVRSASAEQVRQPLYSTSVHRWRDYEGHIGRLVELLRPSLLRLPVEARPHLLQGL
jgi:tetratricopeptide (TPR) repeat protein